MTKKAAKKATTKKKATKKTPSKATTDKSIIDDVTKLGIANESLKQNCERLLSAWTM